MTGCLTLIVNLHSNMAAVIGRAYSQAFDRSPAGTLAITNGALSGVADIVAQSAQIGVSRSRPRTRAAIDAFYVSILATKRPFIAHKYR